MRHHQSHCLSLRCAPWDFEGNGAVSCINRDIRPTYNITAMPIPVTTWDERSRRRYKRTIHREIEADINLTSHWTVHLTMQSDAFTHAFQWTTFTVTKFEEGLDRVNAYLQVLGSRLNSNLAFKTDNSFTLETTFIRVQSFVVVLCSGSRHHASPA